MHNCTGITSSYSSVIFFGNVISDQYCENTGIRLFQSNIQASNNAIARNMGSGVFADAASTAIVSSSNILDNEPYGLQSFAPPGSFMANDNFWGTVDGSKPSKLQAQLQAMPRSALTHCRPSPLRTSW